MIVETNQLTKRFDAFIALDSVNLHVEKGSIYGLVGPNGAGKTTLIRHIAGVMKPTSGTVSVSGLSVWENPVAKQSIIHIPENLYFFPSASINDMKNFYKQTYPKFDLQRFETLKQAFSLPLTSPVRKFSRGMQKQVYLWLALCCRPDVLLLDEPVDGLDPVIRRMVWSLLLQDVSEYQTTVIISSHNLRELEDVCEHVGIMEKGKLILERSLADMQNDIIKLQVAFQDSVPLEINNLSIIHQHQNGRVHEYIIRGNQQDVLKAINALNPLFADILPLSLEEIFVYELGGHNYAEILI